MVTPSDQRFYIFAILVFIWITLIGICAKTNAADHAIVSEQIFYEEVKQ